MVKNYLSRSRYNAFSNLQLQSHLPGASQHHWCFPARGRANAFYDSRLQTGKAHERCTKSTNARAALTLGARLHKSGPQTCLFSTGGVRIGHQDRSPGYPNRELRIGHQYIWIGHRIVRIGHQDSRIGLTRRIGHRESVTKRIKTCSSIPTIPNQPESVTKQIKKCSSIPTIPNQPESVTKQIKKG